MDKISLEAHYPTQLCDAISHAFIMALHRLGCKDEIHIPLNPAAQLLSGKQSANNKLPPAVPEYRNKICTLWIKETCVWPPQWHRAHNFKLLNKFSVRSKDVEQLHSQIEAVCSSVKIATVPSMEQLETDIDCVQVFGVMWEPEEEFCKAAWRSEHPMSVHSVLPQEIRAVIEESVNNEPVEVAKERLRYLLKWNKRARELEADEAALKSSMDPVVSRAVANKRILLFEEMLKDCGYLDLGVISELREGADLIGDVPSLRC